MPDADAKLDLVIATSDHDSPGSVAEQAERAEKHGFARVSMGEATGWNVVAVLALVAERTTEIGISRRCVLTVFAVADVARTDRAHAL